MVRFQTYDRQVLGSTPGRVAIMWLSWVTFCGQVNHLDIITNIEIKSVFYSSGVDKSSTGLSG